MTEKIKSGKEIDFGRLRKEEEIEQKIREIETLQVAEISQTKKVSIQKVDQAAIDALTWALGKKPDSWQP
jgi:hypothetical protein